MALYTREWDKTAKTPPSGLGWCENRARIENASTKAESLGYGFWVGLCYPCPAYDRAVWGIVARRCASEKGVQPQNLYFGRAGSGSGARAAMLLVAASACARNASSTR